MKKAIAICVCILFSVIFALGASAKTVKLGDVNNDSKITASDARKILRFAATLDTCDNETLEIADVDNNDKITASDARKVLRVAANLDKEFGEITIGEETEESTTAIVEKTEIKDAIGMTIANFMKQFGSMSKDGTSDGTIMYHNDQLIIISDPEMIDDTKINSITVSGTDYTLNGVFVGMASGDAERLLLNDGWKIKAADSSSVTFSKNSDLMKITVRNGNVAQIELCLAVSIATQTQPETTTQEPETQETTTQETTTKEPETQETTTQAPVVTPPEETTSPDKNENNDLSKYPEQVRSFLNGKFGFSGTIYNANEEPDNVTMYTDGKNVCMDIKMAMSEDENDEIDVRVLIINEDNSDKSEMYIVNLSKNEYAKFDPKIFGGSMEDFKFNVNVSNLDVSQITEEKQTVDGIKYDVYKVSTPSGITRIYTVNGEIKRVESYDTKDSKLSTLVVNSFYTTLPDNIFSYTQYQKALFGIMDLFM